jgi:hypothetical protein
VPYRINNLVNSPYNADPMDSRLPILLREKYALVHVPGTRRCLRWVERCRAEIDAGVPPEAAGRTAARSTFPYEAHDRANPDASPVVEILRIV